MKNIFCLFERPFKIQNNGVFLIEIYFFVLKILTFFYQANWINDDVIILQLKRGKNGINDISGTIKAVFLKLGTIDVDHKRSNHTLSIDAKNKISPFTTSKVRQRVLLETDLVSTLS